MGRVFALVLLAAFGAILYWASKERSGQQQRASNGRLSMLTDLVKGLQSQVQKDKQGWTLNILIVITFLCILQLGLYFMWPDWYMQHWHDGWLVFTEIAAGIGFAMRVRDPIAKPMRHLVGTAILAIVLLVTVRNTFFPPSSGPEKTESSTNAQAATRSDNFIIPNGTPDCFKEKLGPDKDAAYAAFPGQMDLMAVFCRESRFNHMDPEDISKVYAHKNIDEQTKQVTSVDWGIAQINSVHDPELKRLGLDKSKLEDNLKYAGILYEKNGLKDWIPKVGEKLVFEVEVSDKWSNTFKMPQIDPSERPFNYGIKWSKGTLIIALDDESRIINANNGENIGYPKNYKFRSGEAGEKILVTVTYQY